MDKSKTVVLMVFHSLPQARIVKSLLEAHNIPSFLSSEAEVLIGSFFAGAEVKLYVMQSDYRAAKQILTEDY
ncbi:MAG: DUF2007 domain-containing protein [Prevotellaceae bacterium]|jgi:hypothetical protein|nr:DUF2007 domain-containing protein [Prevotellaceae bacterium]